MCNLQTTNNWPYFVCHLTSIDILNILFQGCFGYKYHQLYDQLFIRLCYFLRTWIYVGKKRKGHWICCHWRLVTNYKVFLMIYIIQLFLYFKPIYLTLSKSCSGINVPEPIGYCIAGLMQVCWFQWNQDLDSYQ